jgi:hypothetical protein
MTKTITAALFRHIVLIASCTALVVLLGVFIAGVVL